MPGCLGESHLKLGIEREEELGKALDSEAQRTKLVDLELQAPQKATSTAMQSEAQ